MLQRKSKKVFIYFFLFLIIGSLNNKNFNEINFIKINKIEATGLGDQNNYELIKNLNFLKKKNLFLIDKSAIIEILNSNTLIEKYSVFINYPSTLKINISKTNFLAQVRIKGNNFFLGSNGKLTKVNELRKDLPLIFGNYENKNFFDLKKAIDETNFNYNQIKNLFFYKSGRWDIETNKGLLIKLPSKEIKKSIELLLNFLDNYQEKKINEVDLRQSNQIIVNG